MRVTIAWRTVFSGACLAALVAAAPAAAQSTATSTETRRFEILSVDGNRVVVRGERGTQEITVPDDFKLTVDGRAVTVAELKPGMKGTATITTTTTTTPVHVTEVKNGEVMQKVGNSIIVRSENGIKMFSEADADRRHIRITRGGQPVDFNELRQGDRLSATIITNAPPKVMTERQVSAHMASAGGAAAGGSGAPTGGRPASGAASSGDAGAAAAGAAAPARTLPKTASALPAIALAGLTLLAAGMMLTLRRRSRS